MSAASRATIAGWNGAVKQQQRQQQRQLSCAVISTSLRGKQLRSGGQTAVPCSKDKKLVTRCSLLDAVHGVTSAGLSAEAVTSAFSNWHLSIPPLGVGVGLPCTIQNCGDQYYRETLDPILRQERGGLTTQGAALLFASGLYLLSSPGVALGWLDTYFLGPIQQSQRKPLKKEDFKLGQKLGKGSFGVVYDATYLRDGSRVVLKRCVEYGDEEAYMNDRVSRASSGDYFAKFLGSFSEVDKKGDEIVWLCWRYEGDGTLNSYMKKSDFPYCCEEIFFGRTLDEYPKGPARRAVTIKEIMRQLFEALQGLHGTGIVHRDIKPENLLISKEEGKIKIIDLGAAADLRVGINYVPNEYLLDPRYAPPQIYIMSTQTPEAPPSFIAVGLAPILWALNLPDRFDMYSCGVTMIQLIFPSLRGDNALIAFNKELKKEHKFSIKKWERSVLGGKRKASRDMQEGFEILNQDNGALMDLLVNLIKKKGPKRVSATEALLSPAMNDTAILAPAQALKKSFMDDSQDINKNAAATGEWLFDRIARSGTKELGGFTEADLRGYEESGEMPDLRERALATIARIGQGASGTQKKVKNFGQRLQDFFKQG